ncbi:MAG: hypothetical protein ACI4QI_04900, partial [Candidatus Coproplasma sp.]
MNRCEKLELFHKGLDAKAYEFFGCHRLEEGNYVFRLWAPHAVKVCLIGDFNNFEEDVAVMEKLPDGESWEIIVNASEGDCYQFLIHTYDGRKLYKADPYSFRSDFPNSKRS